MIIFDLDGTLINSERFLKEIEAELKCELGFSISVEEQIDRFSGIGPHQQLALDARLPKQFAELAEARFREHAEGNLQANPGVPEFLQARNERCLIASNGPLEWIDLALQVTGLRGFFADTDLFHIGLVENKKPAPDIYLLATKDIEDTEQVVVIEDSLVGVKAAVAADLTVVGYTGSSHDPSALEKRMLELGAEGVAESFNEIESYLSA